MSDLIVSVPDNCLSFYSVSKATKSYRMSRLMTKPTKWPSKDTDQPGYPSSLIRVFAVRSMGS